MGCSTWIMTKPLIACTFDKEVSSATQKLYVRSKVGTLGPLFLGKIHAWHLILEYPREHIALPVLAEEAKYDELRFFLGTCRSSPDGCDAHSLA